MQILRTIVPRIHARNRETVRVLIRTPPSPFLAPGRVQQVSCAVAVLAREGADRPGELRELRAHATGGGEGGGNCPAPRPPPRTPAREPYERDVQRGIVARHALPLIFWI